MAKTDSNKPKRAKDEHREHSHYEEGLSDNMTSFLNELYSVQGGKYKGIRLTSGVRQKKEGDGFSHHHTGDAIDVAAWREGGDLGREMYAYLMNTSEGLSLLDRHGLAILDETNPELMKKTGASAPHFHIGKDSKFRPIVKERLLGIQSGNIKPLYSYISQDETFDYSNPKKALEERAQGTPTDLLLSADAPLDPVTGEAPRSFIDELNALRGRMEEQEEKTKKSDARQKLENEKKKKVEEEQAIQNQFIKAFTNIGKRARQGRPGQIPQVDYKEEKFEPIEIQRSLPSLPTIFDIPGFENGGTTGVDPEPVPKTAKDIENERYFTILNALRSRYKHLDPESQQWSEPGVFDFGKGPIKGFDERGFMPLSKEDEGVWRVGSHQFKPNPERYVDLGISGLDRTSFEDEFKKSHTDLSEDDLKTQLEEAWQEAYMSDRVVLAPREHDKYGDLWIPVGTGKKSEKIAEKFNKEFGRYYKKGKQILPYYTLDEGSSPAERRKAIKTRESYDAWRQELQKGSMGEFSTGVSNNRFGGVIRYDAGGEKGGPDDPTYETKLALYNWSNKYRDRFNKLMRESSKFSSNTELDKQRSKLLSEARAEYKKLKGAPDFETYQGEFNPFARESIAALSPYGYSGSSYGAKDDATGTLYSLPTFEMPEKPKTTGQVDAVTDAVTDAVKNEIPKGFGVWIDTDGTPLKPEVYGYAPTTEKSQKRQISQPADKGLLLSRMSEYEKTGNYPWGRKFKFPDGGKKRTLRELALEKAAENQARIAGTVQTSDQIPTEVSAKPIPMKLTASEEAEVQKRIARDVKAAGNKDYKDDIALEQELRPYYQAALLKERDDWMRGLTDEQYEDLYGQSWAGRAFDIAMNPLDAFKYSVTTGDFRNMPKNYASYEAALAETGESDPHGVDWNPVASGLEAAYWSYLPAYESYGKALVNWANNKGPGIADIGNKARQIWKSVGSSKSKEGFEKAPSLYDIMRSSSRKRLQYDREAYDRFLRNTMRELPEDRMPYLLPKEEVIKRKGKELFDYYEELKSKGLQYTPMNRATRDRLIKEGVYDPVHLIFDRSKGGNPTDIVKAGFDGNFLTKPLTPFGKNELTPGNQLYRKIGNEAGLRDLINKGGAQAPAPMRMKSGFTVDTPFFGVGSKPNENYRGLFAVETALPSKSNYKWSNYVGGTSNYGVAPFNEQGLVKNIPLEDLNVYRRKWFSNNYRKLDPENLEQGLKGATAQRVLENLLKWGVRGGIGYSVYDHMNQEGRLEEED